MSKVLKYFGATYIVFVALVTFLNFTGKITFGHGLGDFFYLVFLLIASCILSFFFLNKSFSGIRFTVMALMILLVIFICLKLTIYRGPEYSWNGSFFIA